MGERGSGSAVPATKLGPRGDWRWALLLFTIVCIVYLPAWTAGFFWDDFPFLLNNACIAGPLGLKEIWTTSSADICPLTLTTFWGLHALWGFTPLPYHLLNIIMHGACAVVLWRVLESLRIPGAWLGAALWAVHPVQVESVAWITELKNTQSGLFFLLSILFFIRWRRAGNAKEPTGSGLGYVLCLIFAALAMASKSSTVVLPVVICLVTWWLEGRWRWIFLVQATPLFVFSIAATAASMGMEAQQLTVFPDPPLLQTWPQRLIEAGDDVWFYLSKLVWPHPLLTIYPRWRTDADQWILFLPLLGVVTAGLILWLKREAWSRSCFFAFAYFLILLLPGLGLVDNVIFIYAPVFDHFQYLASIGPMALVGAGVARLSGQLFPRQPWLRAVPAATLLLVLGIMSWLRASLYQNPALLWADSINHDPNGSVAYTNLAGIVQFNGQVDGAMTLYRMALMKNPNDVVARNAVARILSQNGRMDDAIQQYRISLGVNPRCAATYIGLGDIFSREGRPNDAIAQYRNALECDPHDVMALDHMGDVLLQTGKANDAIAAYREAGALNPLVAEIQNKLGVALARSGKTDEGIDHLQQAIKLHPSFAEAHNNLGNALAQKGDLSGAIAEYERAIQLSPGYTHARSNLASAYLQNGNVDKAIAEFQEVLRENPGDVDAQKNLARARAMAPSSSGK